MSSHGFNTPQLNIQNNFFLSQTKNQSAAVEPLNEKIGPYEPKISLFKQPLEDLIESKI